MAKSQLLALGIASGSMVAFAVGGGTALVFVQNIIASLPF